ncbi:hypothetical protein [Alysiella crassa]|uniref:Uncharacterized protein n=1 Tax=Alysiella crassa TaxID=153491 RepID=A0A376BU58_9NEIS|nr:hypothetical protein [Alysiella crassa]UOP06075.1 hypothetical protein LVJ80_09515 [Alysiella crassa]SSY80532.1 Uncharacterised protein [Alysiella crassa]
MDFKVASFFQPIQRNENEFDKSLYLFDEIDDFFCLKILKETKTKTKGVQKTDNSLDSADNFILSHEGKRLVELRYVFIDKSTRRIFYTISGSDLDKILRQYFSYTDIIQYDVDIEKLDSITKINLEVHKNWHHDWVNPNAVPSTLQNLQFDKEPDKTIVQMEYATPTRLLKGRNFQQVIDEYKIPNTKLTMRGFDEQGNTILVTDKVQLLVEIDIVFNDAADLDRIPLSDFCYKLRNKANEL